MVGRRKGDTVTEKPFGVRIGASQSTGGQTQATVQIDITKGLKLQGTAAAGAPPATPVPGVDYGSSVGITYQFEY